MNHTTKALVAERSRGRPRVLLGLLGLACTLGTGCVEVSDDPSGLGDEAQRSALEPLEPLDELVTPEVRDDPGGCSGLDVPLRLRIEAPLPARADLVLPGDDARLTLSVVNVSDERLEIEPQLVWRDSVRVEREITERITLEPGAAGELVLDLDRGLDTTAHPATVDVFLRPFHGRARYIDEQGPTIHFHVDPQTGDWLAYDEEGMRERHRAGDLLGTHPNVDERDDVAGVGIAHLAQPEELVGDPDDDAILRGDPSMASDQHEHEHDGGAR